MEGINLFEKLFAVSENSNSLDNFLNENIQIVYDFYNSNYSDTLTCKDSIERFILLKAKIIEQLDFKIGYNKTFISILLDFSERFNLNSAIPIIYSILESNEINIGHRLQAALLYMYNIDSSSRLVERFELICEKLQISIELEEDNETKALSTFLNYYATVILNTHIKFAESIRLKTQVAIEQSSYTFLKSKFISDALLVSLTNAASAYLQIQSIVDKLLSKVEFAQKYFIVDKEDLLIEENTDYSKLLLSSSQTFKSIRAIAVNKVRFLTNKNEIYYSLGRGVAILNEEAQMYSYLNSFGSAHHGKMLSALSKIQFESITNNVSLFDWGCGQGLASIAYYDYLKSKSISLNNTHLILIEPSVLCIKRAALHVKSFDNNIAVRTICKDLDSLKKYDLKSIDTNIKIHFFSNILDVDDFSIPKLISLIESTQKGVNYFVCVSPYVTDAKTERLDSFYKYFEAKYETFELLGDKTNGGRKEDEYWSCNNKYKNCMCAGHPFDCDGEKKWTRVIRVFKIEL